MQSHSTILSTLGILAIALLALYLLRSVCRYYVSAQGHIMGANMEKICEKIYLINIKDYLFLL